MLQVGLALAGSVSISYPIPALMSPTQQLFVTISHHLLSMLKYLTLLMMLLSSISPPIATCQVCGDWQTDNEFLGTYKPNKNQA